MIALGDDICRTSIEDEFIRISTEAARFHGYPVLPDELIRIQLEKLDSENLKAYIAAFRDQMFEAIPVDCEEDPLGEQDEDNSTSQPRV